MTEERVMVNRSNEADGGFSMEAVEAVEPIYRQRARLNKLRRNLDRRLERWLSIMRRDLERTWRLNQWLREGRR